MTQSTLDTCQSDIEKAIGFLKKEFAGLQTGRATTSLVEDLKIEVYGATQPLKHVANLSVVGGQEIMIDPWDKSQLKIIEKAILDSSLGLTPNNSGAAIILNVPPLTEERRRDLVKVVHQKSEAAKVSVRQVRHAAMDTLKKNDDLSEDEQKNWEKKVQEAVDTGNKNIDELGKHKEAEVMKV